MITLSGHVRPINCRANVLISKGLPAQVPSETDPRGTDMTAMLVPTMVVLCASTMILFVAVAMICIPIVIHIVMCMDAIRYTMTIILGQISNEDLNNNTV